jgi:hypothetical protein
MLSVPASLAAPGLSTKRLAAALPTMVRRVPPDWPSYRKFSMLAIVENTPPHHGFSFVVRGRTVYNPAVLCRRPVRAGLQEATP